MDCPIDGTELVIADRAGVEIDYCPKCRGVWLDRGELDKILDRTLGDTRSARDDNSRRRERSYDDDYKRETRSDDRKKDHKSDGDKYRQKRKKGKLEDFIGDLFDF